MSLGKCKLIQQWDITWFTAWPLLGTSIPSIVAVICRSLCSLCCVNPERTKVVADLGCTNSNQGSTTTGGCTQPTQWAYREYPAWVIGRLCPCTLHDTHHIRWLYPVWEIQQLYLIPRNKHREVATLRRQRNMDQMKEQNKTPEKIKQRVQNTGYKDAQWTDLNIMKKSSH